MTDTDRSATRFSASLGYLADLITTPVNTSRQELPGIFEILLAQAVCLAPAAFLAAYATTLRTSAASGFVVTALLQFARWYCSILLTLLFITFATASVIWACAALELGRSRWKRSFRIAASATIAFTVSAYVNSITAFVLATFAVRSSSLESGFSLAMFFEGHGTVSRVLAIINPFVIWFVALLALLMRAQLETTTAFVFRTLSVFGVMLLVLAMSHHG